jgi:nitroimidazol reductase NimA-like FMN-containing flavoprotein (pyridoxamine 5'-phosphate oxidase superfamily)
MKYETLKLLKEADFKRCTGVHRRVFEFRLAVVESGLREFGRPPLLSRAEQLLLTLMYWREYRTEFHLGLAYGVSESTVCRTIPKIEKVLLQSKQFHLPGKKALAGDTPFEIVVVDATAQALERPKKSRNATTVVKRNVTLKKHR